MCAQRTNEASSSTHESNGEDIVVENDDETSEYDDLHIYQYNTAAESHNVNAPSCTGRKRKLDGSNNATQRDFPVDIPEFNPLVIDDDRCKIKGHANKYIFRTTNS
ncbi:MAG: hypothetical protein AAF387_18850 [Pseudomonadota bacterium]